MMVSNESQNTLDDYRTLVESFFELSSIFIKLNKNGISQNWAWKLGMCQEKDQSDQRAEYNRRPPIGPFWEY